MAHTTQDLRQLDRDLFELTKKWENAALACKVIGVLLGMAALLLGLKSQFILPSLALALTLFAEYCSRQAGRYSGLAGPLLAKLEWSDAFGWNLSGMEIADLLLKLPQKLKQNFSMTIQEEYYASKEAVGPRRAVENVLESAWWSKYLSEKVGARYQQLTWIMLVFSFAGLIISIQTIRNQEHLLIVGRALTTFVMWIFSFGVLKLERSYSGFSKKSAGIEKRAEELLKGDPSQEESIMLIYDYQIARMRAPQIPTRVYKKMQGELNRLWDQFVQQQKGSGE